MSAARSPSFAHLRNWASSLIPHGSVKATLEHVLANAERPAPYESPDTAAKFREELVKQWEQAGGESADGVFFLDECIPRACDSYFLTGKRIESGVMPRKVCRLTAWSYFRQNVMRAQGLTRAADRNLDGAANPPGTWQNASQVFHAECEVYVGKCEHRGEAVNARRTERRAVFVAFEFDEEESPRPDPGKHNGFWTRLQKATEQGERGDIAVQAAILLGLQPASPPNPVKERVLLEYESERFKEWRFPVPPDAEKSDRFRPAPPHAGWKCGRTFTGDCDEREWASGKAGTNEAVHPNTRLPLGAIELRGIGKA